MKKVKATRDDKDSSDKKKVSGQKKEKGTTDINARDENGETVLIRAAREGQIKTVKSLIDQGANIEAKTNEGMTALICAAHMGHTDTVELLIAKGSDIEGKDIDGATALVHAAGVGHSETVEMLLYKGANIEAKSDAGGTPLFAAAINGQIDCVKMLIGAGADVNVISKKGKTILMRAAEEGHTEVVKYLAQRTSGSGTKESLKALKLTIGTVAWEQEREDGTLIVGGKILEGYAIYENKAAYNFIYDLTKKESVQNAAMDLVSGDLRHADNMESEGSENKGVCYYNGKGEESNDIDEFIGVGDTEVVNIETPYGYSEVVLELSDSTRIKSVIKKTGIEQNQCFDYFKKETNGAKILKLLSDL